MSLTEDIKTTYSVTEDVMNERISENLKTIRKNMGLNQESLAEMLGINNRKVLSGWENGKAIPLFELAKISLISGTKLDDIIFGEVKLINKDSNKYILDIAKKIKRTIENDIIGDNPFWGDLLLPIVGPDNILKYFVFKEAYNIDKDCLSIGDNSRIIEILDKYQMAFDLGLTEAAANILKIQVSLLLANNISLDNDEGVIIKEKLGYYVEALEAIDNPIGSYYKALFLVHGLSTSNKEEDERIKEGLSLMSKLNIDGNELASRYLKYFESHGKAW